MVPQRGPISNSEDIEIVSRTLCNAIETNGFQGFLTLNNAMVPGGRIELPTRGFSVPCSTTELPGRCKTLISKAR